MRVAPAPRAGAADGKLRTDEPQHREAIDKLLPDVEAAFAGPSFWGPFVERAHDAAIPRLSEWLNGTGRIVAEQLGRRGRRSARPADTPRSTSPLDGFINPIRASIQPRAYGLKNRDRTNQMLMLMQLRANGQHDERALPAQWGLRPGIAPRVRGACHNPLKRDGISEGEHLAGWPSHPLG